jgi:hypothetical protein
MSLAGRICLAALLFWQGEAFAQEGELPFAGLKPLFRLPPRTAGFRNAPPAAFEVHSSPAAQSRESRLRPWLFWSAGLALAAGGTAWWSQRRAERAYDRYLHAAGFQRQEEQLRRARQYDRVSGAAYVVMETGIVFTTYLVFF